jgi:hypothetical protein
MRRDKRRFDRFFHMLDWLSAYNQEFWNPRCGDYEDGYYCEHTEGEHEAMYRRADRCATQYANEVVGRLA